MTLQPPSREGKIAFEIPERSELSCYTFYKVFGELDQNTPVVILHGGPGSGHDSLIGFANLWSQYNLPVIFYDQVGCGNSTHLPETAGDESLWNIDLFKLELDNLLDHFNLRRQNGTGYHIYGHSWGANLAAYYATYQPLGLRRLVISSGMASRRLYRQGLELRRDELPSEMAKRMRELEKSGAYDHPEYEEAMNAFMKKFLCRDDPFPPEILAALRKQDQDRTVQETM